MPKDETHFARANALNLIRKKSGKFVYRGGGVRAARLSSGRTGTNPAGRDIIAGRKRYCLLGNKLVASRVQSYLSAFIAACLEKLW
ncbi:MAG: hypothetical protein ACYDBT_17695 [Desulfobulbaceae bacterium]